jgi:hypothetical protein
MKADLGAVDRASVPWVLAHFHRPLYCAGDGACLDSDGKGDAKYIKGKTEDIFYENHVNLVFYGHVHSYQVSGPQFPDFPIPRFPDSPFHIPFAVLHISLHYTDVDTDGVMWNLPIIPVLQIIQFY